MNKTLADKLLFPAPHTRPPKHRDSKLRNIREVRDYSPLPWNHSFSQQLDVKTSETDSFHVYTLGTEGPVVLLLHGGGHSALTWSLFAASLVGLVKCRVLAMDSRGHGGTMTSDYWDLSWERQVQDAANVFNKMYVSEDVPAPPVVLVGHSMGGAVAVRMSEQGLLASQVGLVVIDVVEGSAVDALCHVQGFLKGRPDRFKSVEDAIEWNVRTGQIRNLYSARVSVPGVLRCFREDEIFNGKKCKLEPATSTSVLTDSPTDCAKLNSQHKTPTYILESTGDPPVIESTGAPPVIESTGAPPVIKSTGATPVIKSTGAPPVIKSTGATPVIESTGATPVIKSTGATPVIESTDVTFVNEATNGINDSQQKPVTLAQAYRRTDKGFTWRIDLSRTEPYWRGWFEGLSSLFLSCPVPKILIIAGIDRLDRELTIGQMQGKFQFHVLSKCSHVVHEDAPEEVAELIGDFMLRFKLTTKL